MTTRTMKTRTHVLNAVKSRSGQGRGRGEMDRFAVMPSVDRFAAIASMDLFALILS